MSCSLHQTVLPKRQRRAGQWRRDRARSDRARGPAPSRRARRPRPGRRRRARWSCASCCCRRRSGSRSRAEPLEDAEGRRETAEEALIRALVEQEVRTPEADIGSLPALLRAEPSSVPLAGYLRGRAYPVRRSQVRSGRLCASARGGQGGGRHFARTARAFRRAGADALRLPVGGAGRQSRPDHRRSDHARIRAGPGRARAGNDRSWSRSRRATGSTSFASTASMTVANCRSSWLRIGSPNTCGQACSGGRPRNISRGWQAPRASRASISRAPRRCG